MNSWAKGRVRARQDVVFRELGEEMVLLNLRTGIYFGLNETGTRMWTLLMELKEPARVLHALEEEYAVSRTQLENDLRSLLDVLREKGLIEVDEN